MLFKVGTCAEQILKGGKKKKKSQQKNQTNKNNVASVLPAGMRSYHNNL